MVLAMKRMLGRLLLIIFGLVIGLFIAEMVLRFAGISYPAFYRVDNLTGIALIAGAEGWSRNEGEAYVRINKAGFRDQDHSKQKPANTLRIAVLGDSYAEAPQVPLESTFWAVASQELQGCGRLDGQRVEVLNFGVSGYGTAQELLTLRHRVWDYSPDMVMLAITTANDISDNVRELKQINQSSQSKVIPYFVYLGNALVLDNSFLESEEYRSRLSRGYSDKLRNHSRLLQMLNHVRQLRANNWRPKLPGWIPVDREHLPEPGLLDDIYRQPSTSVWDAAWRLTEDLVVQMRDEVARKRAKYIVVTLSNGIQVHPDAAVRERFKESLGITELFYPDMRIKSLGEREHFPVINLAPRMRAYASEHKLFLHGFDNTMLGIGHWNENGHGVAGHIIANEICSKYLPIGKSAKQRFEKGS
jgi:hypothetical protein